MRLRLDALAERLRASLFVFPTLALLAAAALGGGLLALDRHLDQLPGRLPLALVTTVDGAQALLGTIAGATISFAGIAFSVSLLIIQQASSQHSPRVVHTLFRDPFNKRVLGLVVGTFTYCVIVLRSVRGPLEPGGSPVLPNVSVAVAVVLAVATILATVAFIDHSAHSMDVSEILERVRRRATSHIRAEWHEADAEVDTADEADTEADTDTDDPGSLRAGPQTLVRFTRTGWVQQLDAFAMAEALPEGSVVELQAEPGRYAIRGAVLATVSPPVADPDAITEALNDAIASGDTRTMQQDASYGLRQLADVALKALSPAINDPTTAQDAIFHSAAVLTELLQRDPPHPRTLRHRGRTVIAAQRPTHDDLVRLAFEETRRAAAPHPAVSVYLLEALELVAEPLYGTALERRVGPVIAQAELIVAGCRAADLLPHDLDQVEQAYAKRFGDVAGSGAS